MPAARPRDAAQTASPRFVEAILKLNLFGRSIWRRPPIRI
jgi:hypothetical protein